jgi:hypothetical protein
MTTTEVDTDSSSNWRDPSSYAYTKNLTHDDWAWEFLRRNRAYAKIAATLQASAWRSRRLLPAIEVIDASDAGNDALPWGLNFLRSGGSPRSRRYGLLAGRSQSCGAPHQSPAYSG